MATLEWHEVLRVRSEGYSDVAGVNLFDSEGVLINSSDTWPVPDVKIADRAYFKAFKSGAAVTPVLVELVQSRFTSGWATVIAHKVTGPKGEFLGSSQERLRQPASKGTSHPLRLVRARQFPCTTVTERCWRVIRMSK